MGDASKKTTSSSKKSTGSKTSTGAKKAHVASAPRGGRKPRSGSAAKPVLLSGGNPQIPKGEGDAPVQAYIEAMPGWKQGVGRRVDALVTRTVPDVHKAVKWNSPFYGIEGQGWFLNFHCYTRYVKLAFFRGTSLDPVPPGASKTPEARYFDVHEEDPIDEAQLEDWVLQASRLPGEKL